MLSAVMLVLRRDRSDLAALGLVALLIAFTTFVFVAGVRLFERAADDALRAKVGAAAVVQRTIQLTASRSLFGEEASRTVADWQAAGEQERATFPEPIDELTDDGNLAISSMSLRVSNPPEYPFFVTLRYQDEFEPMVELVSGRWPASTNELLPPVAEFESTSNGQPTRPIGTVHYGEEPRRFEIAIQERTAQALGLDVGSQISVDVDLFDPMFQGSIIGRVDVMLAPTILEVSGLYRVPDNESDAWFGDPRLVTDDLGDMASGDVLIAYITAYVAPDAVPGLVSSGLPFEYQWRFPILVDRLDANDTAATRSGLRVLEARAAGTEATGEATIQTGLLPLIERHGTVRDASEAVLAIAVSAPLALAAGALAMAAVLLIHRRRAALLLTRGRGASSRLMFASSLVESVLVAAVASLTGLALAIVLEPAAELGPSAVTATLIALIAIVVLSAAAWPQIRRPLADLESEARPPRRTDARRLAAELTVVTLAVVGAYVLRQRGVAAATQPTTTDTGAVVGFDPFLAAVPPLIAIAVGIIAVRLYRPAMGIVGWLADRRRDLVLVLGARTVARGAAPSLPVLVLLLAVAFAAFMSVVSTSVDRAQVAASWAAVGADVRLDPPSGRTELPSGTEPGEVPGVISSATGFIELRARVPPDTGLNVAPLHAVEAPEYAAVVAGSPIDPHWPAEFLNQPDDGPVPVILGSRLTGGELRLGIGDQFVFMVLGRQVPAEVVEVRSDFVGLGADDAFMVVPYTWLEAALGQDVKPTVAWIKVPPESVAVLGEQLGADEGGARLTSRYDVYSGLHDEPLLGAVGAAFALALAVSLAYAVLTVFGAVILSAGRRTRDSAILRTLGLNRRQETRLTMIEHTPPILVALPVGIALGIGVAFAVAPALGLGRMTGSSGAIPLTIDWPTLAMLSGLLAAVALVAVVIGTWLSRRAAIINALRMTSD